MQSGNTLELLSDDRLLELASIVFGDAEGAGAELAPLDSPAAAPTPSKQIKSAEPRKAADPATKKKKIYTWTDENGRLHISDVKPEQ